MILKTLIRKEEPSCKRFKSLRNSKVCETVGPIDNEVHVFSNYVLCVGDFVRNHLHGKMERASRTLQVHRKKMMENKFHSYFATIISLRSRRTRSCSKSMNEFDKVKEKMDNRLLQKPTHIELFSSEWWTTFWFLHKDARRWMTCSLLRKFKPWYFMKIGPDSETRNFENYNDNPKGKWDELTRQVTDVSFVQNIQSWKEAKTSLNETWYETAKTLTSTQESHLKSW